MKHRFRVGDRVKVTHTGLGVGVHDEGKTVRITELGDYLGEPGYRVSPPIGNSKTGEYDGFIEEETFERNKTLKQLMEEQI